MINEIFKKYDEEATIENARVELESYRGLFMKWQRLRLDAMTLSAQEYDGLPGGATNVNHEEEKRLKQLEKQEKVEVKLKLMQKSIELMGEVDDKSERLASLLELRYLKGYSVVKTCYEYADRFGLTDLPRQTYHDHLKEALLTFAEVYPHELRVEKSSY